MKVILVEDEKHARDNLERLLLKINPNIKILTKLESVRRTVEWLKTNQADLIFLDIHLADDICFKIFEEVNVTTPVIFTTAYDKYALKAFKVNSVDYLLKPIDEEELAQSLEKYQATNTQFPKIVYSELENLMQQAKQQYQQRFMVSRRDRILSLTVNQIAYFEGEDRYVYLTDRQGKRFIVDYKLSDLENLLDPACFFRLNRSFITHFDAIDSITSYSKSRLKVDLTPKARRDIVVSSANARQFKEWLNK